MTTATQVTFNGIDFIFSEFTGSGYLDNVTVDGVDYPRWAAVFVAAMKDINSIQATTSASSVTVGNGTKTFVLAEDVRYQIGQQIKVAQTSSPGVYMYGYVTSYTPATKTLVMTVTQSSGSGSHSDWTVNISPPQGTFAMTSETRSSNTALAAADSGKIIIATSAFTQTINAQATLPVDWICFYHNASTGNVTIDPNSSELISGASSFTLLPNESCWIHWNSTTMRVLMHFDANGFFSDTINDPQNGDYTITFLAPVAGTIDYAEVKTQSGTVTVQFKINGTNCGTTMSGSTTKATQNISSANTFAAGDTISLTTTSFSSAVNLSFNLRYRRA